MPTLVIGAELDPVTPPDLSNELARLIPHAERNILTKCGHLATLAAPSEVAESMRRWLVAGEQDAGGHRGRPGRKGIAVREDFDGLVVAGAGPVGLVTGLKVAQAGVPVVVLESREDVIREPRAIVYHPPTVEVLDSLGLLDDIKRIGVVKDDYQYRTIDGKVLAAWDNSMLEPEDTAYPYNVHLGQHELALVVLRHLLALPDTQVRWGHRVVDVNRTPTAQR